MAIDYNATASYGRTLLRRAETFQFEITKLRRRMVSLQRQGGILSNACC